MGKYTFDLHFILQEKDAEAGDYIVRARGAWFGNRSISAEVDLEPGIYEVLPKIVAKRNSDAPDVHEVVMKVAERNPQKLRQIGLNYDIANAKGITELTEEEEKQKEQKKKAALEKKKKKAEEADKEKAEFEAWKKEEKDEYEAWKKEKKRLEIKNNADKNDKQSDNLKPAESENRVNITTTTDENKKEEPAAAAATESKDTTLGAEGVELVTKTAAPNVHDANLFSDDDARHARGEDSRLHSRASSRSAPRGRRSSPHMYQSHPRSVYGELPREPSPRARSPVDNKQKSWNAVCVLGLRVYSQDSEVSIKLVKPKSLEEGAILDVDGDTAAGATM